MPRALGLTRIALVEDHQLFAEALDVALTLEGHDVYRVPITDPTVSTERLLTAVLRVRPRIVLLDLDLGLTGNGSRMVEPLTRSGMAVIIVTASIDKARWGECMLFGARAVLPKTTPLNSILAAIRLVGAGRRVTTREERDELVACYLQERGKVQELRDRLNELTTREREVLAHLMAGRPVRDIARLSFVSESTVRTQVKSILGKLQVTSQLAAVGAAHTAHWTPPLVSSQ